MSQRPDDKKPSEEGAALEQAARDAIAEILGRPLTEGEWRTTSDRMLAYIRLLRSWDRTKRDNLIDPA